MPTHCVNDAFDPSFMDTIIVNRQVQTIDQTGRVVRTPQTLTAQAVVVASPPDDLQRLPEEEFFNKAVRIYSQFRLQGVADDGVTETQPDEVIWHGSTFVVRLVDDYTGYGRGFVMAIAVSIMTVDPPPMAEGAFPDVTIGSA